ncbi:MAG: hypothetical protein FJY17_00245 [Bacteroidetes bacterium]|nr:hypothetical protein [Bacteroidota bacterium]
MNLKANKYQVAQLIKLVDFLKYDEFYDENNQEEALNELESAVIALESYIEILERDAAFKDAMNTPNEKN